MVGIAKFEKPSFRTRPCQIAGRKTSPARIDVMTWQMVALLADAISTLRRFWA